MNFLESLAAEWYEYTGHFVRTNVRTGKRAGGGWDGELDVLAYDPVSKTLKHVELSSDALSWEKRKERFSRLRGEAHPGSGVPRSHGPRGNALFDAPRSPTGPAQPGGNRSVPDGIPTVPVGTRSLTRSGEADVPPLHRTRGATVAGRAAGLRPAG
jgi:hypothetical protein